MVINERSAFYDAETSKWQEIIDLEVDNGKFINVKCSEIDVFSNDISRFILPGFIDAHVHLLEDPYTIEQSDLIYSRTFDELWEIAKKNMKDALKGGVTSLKDLGGRQYASIALKRRIEWDRDNEGLPRFYTSGCYFTKPKGHGANRGAIIIYDIGNYLDNLLLLKNAGIRFIKILHSEEMLHLCDLKKMVELAHDNGMIVSVHAYHNSTAMEAVNAGADILEHAGDYSDDLLDLMNYKGTIIVPTYVSACDSSEENCKGLGGDINMHIIKQWLNDERKVIPKLFERNIQVALGTDACFPGTACNSLAREISTLYNEFGISIEKLMYSANVITPKTIGMSERLGRIKRGYFADYLCYDRNPFDSIDNIHFPKEVWVNGRRV